MVTVRPAVLSDARALGDLHSRLIPSGFLSSLGQGFLSVLYGELVKSPESFAFVAVRDGTPVGFITAVIRLRNFYAGFLRSAFFRVLPLLFVRMFRPGVIGRILETLLYSGRNEGAVLPGPELLSLAVDPGSRGGGTSGLLWDAMVSEFRRRGAKGFKAVVGAGLEPALKFYTKKGGHIAETTEIHSGEKSFVLVWEL
jgi:GNAT superfamily N-acetyltransferase